MHARLLQHSSSRSHSACLSRHDRYAFSASTHPRLLQRTHPRWCTRSLPDPQSTNTTVTSEAPSVPAAAAPPSPAVADSPSLPPSTIGGAAVAFGAALFLVTRVLNPGPSLASLENNSIPLGQALTNGKPTVMEFYASWCEVCRELVPTEYSVQQNYKDKVNFVMLNIDNTKWAPEVAEFGVRGIPHFVFFDENGRPLSAAVGRLPAEVLEGNTRALAEHTSLPFNGVRERTSSLDAAPPSASRSVGPRDHA